MAYDPALVQYRVFATVKPEEIDELDHVNNAVYLQYVELAARAHAGSVGLDFQGMIAHGGVFVVRRHTISYFRPARRGDHLEIATRIGDMRGARAMRYVWIVRDGELLTEAETEWVWIGPESRRPKPMPPEVAGAFGDAE